MGERVGFAREVLPNGTLSVNEETAVSFAVQNRVRYCRIGNLSGAGMRLVYFADSLRISL